MNTKKIVLGIVSVSALLLATGCGRNYSGAYNGTGQYMMSTGASTSTSATVNVVDNGGTLTVTLSDTTGSTTCTGTEPQNGQTTTLTCTGSSTTSMTNAVANPYGAANPYGTAYPYGTTGVAGVAGTATMNCSSTMSATLTFMDNNRLQMTITSNGGTMGAVGTVGTVGTAYPGVGTAGYGMACISSKTLTLTK